MKDSRAPEKIISARTWTDYSLLRRLAASPRLVQSTTRLGWEINYQLQQYRRSTETDTKSSTCTKTVYGLGNKLETSSSTSSSNDGIGSEVPA